MFQLSMLVFVAMNMKEKNQFFFGNKNLFIYSELKINKCVSTGSIFRNDCAFMSCNFLFLLIIALSSFEMLNDHVYLLYWLSLLFCLLFLLGKQCLVIFNVVYNELVINYNYLIKFEV